MKKRLSYLTVLLFHFICCYPSHGLEVLSNTALGEITGKAVIIPGEINDDFFTPPRDIPNFKPPDSKRFFPTSNNNPGPHKWVLLDFLGSDSTDDFGNTFRENFYIVEEIQDIAYKNPHKESFVLFEGMLKGTITIPEYFDNKPSIKTKELTLSKERIIIPETLNADHYICSYQGNIFSDDSITGEDESFLIYPNRQSQTVGYSEKGKLAILTPHGTGQHTVWKPVIKSITKTPEGVETDYLTIPEGDTYVHIDLNLMTMKNELKYQIKLANNKEGLNHGDPASSPEAVSGTLGSVYVAGGNTHINNGSIFITVNDALN